MKKPNTSATFFIIATALATTAVGVIVYPVLPALVWVVLFLCWACYRLRLRAVARFGTQPVARPASASYWPDEDEDTAANLNEA